jgi:hypothetical protein
MGNLIEKYLTEQQAFLVMAVPTGNEKEIELVSPQKETFTLEEIKNHLKMNEQDYLEAVTCNEEWMFLCDEDGIRKNLKRNAVATEVYNTIVNKNYCHVNKDLVGNVLFIKRNLIV